MGSFTFGMCVIACLWWMHEQAKSKKEKVVLLWIGIIFFVGYSLFTVSGYMAARSKSRSNACQANLRQIDLAIEQYAMDNLKSNVDICRITDIVPTYIRKTPECQCGGTYQSSGCPAGKFIVGKTPTCSIGDSSKCKGYPHILYQ